MVKAGRAVMSGNVNLHYTSVTGLKLLFVRCRSHHHHHHRHRHRTSEGDARSDGSTSRHHHSKVISDDADS